MPSIRLICCALIAGIVVNIAIAWVAAYGAARWFHPSGEGWDSFGFDRRSHTIDAYPIHADSALRQFDRRFDGLSTMPEERNGLVYPPTVTVFPRQPEVVVSSAGWPLRSLRSRTYLGPKQYHYALALGGGQRGEHLIHAIPFTGTPFQQHAFGPLGLPCMPAWPGFVVNSVLYALLITLVFMSGRTLRRRRTGCSSCGYPIGHSDRCSECGALVEVHTA